LRASQRIIAEKIQTVFPVILRLLPERVARFTIGAGIFFRIPPENEEIVDLVFRQGVNRRLKRNLVSAPDRFRFDSVSPNQVWFVSFALACGN